MAFLRMSGLALAAVLGLSLPIGQASAMPANGLAVAVKQIPKRAEDVRLVCGRYRCWSTGWYWHRRPYAYWGWRRPLYAYAGWHRPYWGWHRRYTYWGWHRPYAYGGWHRPLYAYAGWHRPYWGWHRRYAYWGWHRPLYAYAGGAYAGGPSWGLRRPFYGYGGWGWRRPLYAAAVTTGIGLNPWYGGWNPGYIGGPYYANAGLNTWRGWGWSNMWW